MLMILYNGQSSVRQWAAERLFHRDDVAALHNASQLPVVLEMTCFNGLFHELGGVKRSPLSSSNRAASSVSLSARAGLGRGCVSAVSCDAAGRRSRYSVLRGLPTASQAALTPMIGASASAACLMAVRGPSSRPASAQAVPRVFFGPRGSSRLAASAPAAVHSPGAAR